MGVNISCDYQDIENKLRLLKTFADAEMIKHLSRLGDELITEARDRSAEESWEDQTGNLRSSIGWVITHNGTIVKTSSFGVVAQGSEGAQEGRAYAEQLASELSAEWVLIIVAGMFYAAYVEAHETKCVLASARTLGEEKYPRYMKELKKRIENLEL